MSTYGGLGRDRPRAVHDFTALWNRLRQLGSATDDLAAAVAQFCEGKRISLPALEALGTRVMRHHDTGPLLAYAGWGPNGR